MPGDGEGVSVKALQGVGWYRTSDGQVLRLSESDVVPAEGRFILAKDARITLDFAGQQIREFVGPGTIVIDWAPPEAPDPDGPTPFTIDPDSQNPQSQPPGQQTPPEDDQPVSQGWHYVVVLKRVGEELEGARSLGLFQLLDSESLGEDAARRFGEEPDPGPGPDPDPDPDPDPGPGPTPPVPNRPPQTEDLFFTIDEDTTLDSDIPGFDPDGDPLVYEVIVQPQNGSVILDSQTGAFEYVPNADYHGPDQFEVTVSDGRRSATQTTYIDVLPVNDPPQAQDLYLVTPEDTPIPGEVLASDIDGDTLNYTVVDAPDFGSVAFDASTGGFTYTPGPDYVGEDQFTVLVDDGNGGTVEAVVYIAVTPEEDPAVITGDDLGAVTEDDSEPDLLDQGQLLISDPDAGEGAFDPASVAPVGEVLGSLTLDSSGLWQYQLANAEAQYLAEGEVREELFTLASVDGTPATVTVTVTGVNDAPELYLDTGDSDSASLTETNEPLDATGTLTSGDVDVRDTVSAAVVDLRVSGNSGGLSNAALLAMLSVDSADVIASADTEGQVSWAFDSANQSFDYLPEGDRLTLEYTVGVTDSFGATAEHPVTITITGTNDAPVFTGGDRGLVTEDADDPDLMYTGQLTGYDPDGNETAIDDSVAPIPQGSVLGGLVINASGAWTYTLANADVQYLAQNQLRTEQFLVTTVDGTQHAITVVIRGVNDVPEITLEAGDSDTLSLTEADAGLTGGGTLSVADIDIRDSVTPQVTDVSASIDGAFDQATLLAMLSVDAGAVIVSGGTTGILHWTFDSTDETFSVLPDGVDYTLTYTVVVTDSAGGTDTHEVTVTITGTNDEPVFTGGDRGAVTEDVDVQAGDLLTDAAQLTGFDPDYGEAEIDTAVAPLPLGNVLGTFSIQSDGNWEYTVDNALTQYLAVGQTRLEVFQVTTIDGATHPIVITLTGTNDAPLISVQAGDAELASVSETDTTLTASGTLSVADVDVRDSVTPAVDSVSVTSGNDNGIDNGILFAMLSVDATAVIANGDTSGSIQWQFDSGTEYFNYLGFGDSLELTYTVSVDDGNGGNDTQDVVITINGSNDAPVPSGAGLPDQTSEDLETIATVDVSGAFADIDVGDSLTYSAVGLPAGLSISAAGEITGTLDNSASVTSPYTVEVTATDSQGATTSVSFTWTVTNPAPDFIDETTGIDDDTYEYEVYEGLITGTAIINASDPDGDDLSYSIVAGNDDGLFAMDAVTGEMSITRALDDPDLGVRELVIQADDGEGGIDLGSVVVTLLNVNDPPNVYPDTGQVNEDDSLEARVPTPFDVDSPIDPTGYELVSDAGITGGVLVFNTDGSYSFDTNGDFEFLAAGETASVSFTYRLQDSEPDIDSNPVFSAPATITIEVLGVNDAPTFGGVDTGSVTEDSGTYEATGTLTVTDIDNGESAIDNTRTPVSVGSNLGALAIAANGEWTYSVDNADLQYLAEGQTREDVFTVFSVDGTEHQITVTLQGVNDIPTISVGGGDRDSATLVETDAVISTNGQLSVADVDVTDEVTPSVTSVSVISGNDNGIANATFLAMLSVDATAVIAAGTTAGKINWEFDSNADDIFDYLSANDNLVLEYLVTATDGEGVSDSHTVTIVIGGTNDEPEVLDDAVNSDEDTLYNGVVPIAIDDDGTVESYTTAGSPALPAGIFSFNADGTYSVNPVGSYDYLAAGETTDLVFSYRALDDLGAVSDFGQITVTIVGVDDPTQVSSGSGTVREDTTLNTSGQLSVFDIDNPDMAFVADTYSDAYGTLTVAADGSWSYTLNQNATVDALSIGQTFSQAYTVNLTDGGDSATTNDDNITTTVTINIQGINDRPIVDDFLFTVPEDQDLNLQAVSGSDIDGTIFAYGLRSNVAEGILTFQPNGDFRFETNGEFNNLAAGEFRDVIFTYAAADNNGAVSESGTVTIRVTGVDNAPVIGTGSGSVVEDTQPTTTGAIAANDVDNPDLEFVADSYSGIYGDLTVNADGSWSYTLRTNDVDPLDQGDSQIDTIAGIVLSDGSITSVSIDITGTNDAPTLVTPTIALTVGENDTLTGEPLSAITDIDADDTLGGYYLVDSSQFPAGTLVFNTAGSFDFDPVFAFNDLEDGESAALSFTYQGFDSYGALSDVGTVTITITGTSDGGTDNANSGVVVEGDAPDVVTVSGGPIDNGTSSAGTYPDGSGYGELIVNPDGTWTYELDPDAAESLAPGDQVTVNIPTGGTGSVDITIVGTNDEPVVENLACGLVTTGENSVVTGSLTGSDIDGTVVTYEVADASGLQGGSLTIDSNGDFTFDPGTAFDHLDAGDEQQVSFTFRAIDNNGAVSNVGAGCITVTGEDDPPALFPDSGSVIEDDAGSNSASGILVYTDVDDDDVGGGSVTFTPQTDVAGTYGTFNLDANGNWSYTLDNNDSDTDALNVGDQVTDVFAINASNGDSTTVTVTVTGANDVPVIDSGDPNITATVDEDNLLDGTLPEATDVDSRARIAGYIQNGDLTYVSDGTPAPGELIFYADGTYSFDPRGFYDYLPDGESTAVQFSFSAVDNDSGVSAQQTVIITITGVDDAPVITADTVTITEDDANPAASGTLSASDPDDDTVLTFTPATVAGTYGSLTIDANGNWSYSLDESAQTLAGGETGTDTITVNVSDGSTTTVTVNITGINDVPTSDDITVTLDEDSTLNEVVPAAVDVDGNVTAYRLVGGSFSGPGALSVNTDGSYSYDPGDSFQGLDAGDSATVTFQYIVQDNNDGISDPVTVTIEVTGVNDTPTSTVIGNQSSNEGGVISLDVSGNFSDVDEDNVFVYSATGLPASLSIDAATGVISGTLDSDAAAGSPYTVEVTATDSQGVTVSRTFTWTVNNPAPDFIGETSGNDDDTYSFDVNEDDTLGLGVGTVTASDPDNDALTYSIVSGNSAGLFVLDSATGALSLAQTLGDAEVGSYALQVLVDDGEGGTDTATVNINVNNINDAPVADSNTLTVDEESTATPLGLAAPSDADGDSLIITVTGLPGVGEVTLADGSVVGLSDTLTQAQLTGLLYNAPDDLAAIATEVFAYTVDDGQGETNSVQTGSVEITVNPVNDAPVAVDDTVAAVPNDSAGYTIDVLANDTDADGDPLSVTLASAQSGSVTINPDGTLNYVPDPDFVGEDRIIYQVSDPSGASDFGRVDVTVTAAGMMAQLFELLANSPGTELGAYGLWGKARFGGGKEAVSSSRLGLADLLEDSGADWLGRLMGGDSDGPSAVGAPLDLSARPTGGASHFGAATDGEFARFMDYQPGTIDY
ncbi:VCBS domain-containing protein [Gilvimarinus algae]|uniref:VCBS domain-containing protein n=1 Tax=Gilvimarinus algae TaxID=3058037 RepID=A0ABT8T999_9GAMM|nr:VCBS domain-containing protein [Gilvimarinus sp. SDUM040014]MDO3380553.1 VCBS domain-containing protein [Gilvimarinus sp. SDUM040014]